ncbi:MAG TPA: hypothetical protein VFO17_13515 [Acidimicrobiia bacterium]|jgi:hypothetical protein|nr:hypothetical protein [Acidimicrobiia bacterium]
MSDSREVSGWAAGWTIYAAVWMWILGFFHALAGFSAIVEDEIYVTTPEYIYQLDVTTWGWIHLILGVVVLLAGFALFNGAVWARTIGVILAVISTLANFVWLPYQPLWGLAMIAANVFVIWALTAHGRDIAAT